MQNNVRASLHVPSNFKECIISASALSNDDVGTWCLSKHSHERKGVLSYLLTVDISPFYF